MKKREYSILEEILHSASHGLGLLFAIIGLIILIVYSVFKGNIWHIVSTSIYGCSLILMFLNSTVYHALAKTKAANVFQILDHSSIYILIAGTYTPFTLIVIKGALGWTIFSIVWVFAILGVIFKVFSAGKFKIISTIIYLIMGWFIVIAMKQIINTLPKNGLILLIIGGLLYSLGTVFYIFKKIPYFHFVWHIFVLLASIMHFFTIFLYIIPS